ncbi:MAG: hypothetical protein EWV61_11890 [Microcystis aeruginosa Ma_AC_P_19900807_S300]|nr:MAG: hypothetical protein EWV61_11890 [Microcystis aeruginosa Ma_AC_P_19900807_S300]
MLRYLSVISHNSPSPHTQHPTPNTPHPTPNTPHPTPHSPHPTPNTQHPTPNTQHPTPNTLIWNILAEDRSQRLEICSNNSYTSLE